jgi:hypothetical protein
MWIFFFIWAVIAFGIFIGISAIFWLDKKALKNNRKHKYMNNIKIRCPGRVVNYFYQPINQEDKDKQFKYLHPSTHKFFCRIELDPEEFYKRASAYMVRDFRRVDGLSERIDMFGLSRIHYKRMVDDKENIKDKYIHTSDSLEIEMGRVFRKHISVPEPLNLVLTMEEYNLSKEDDFSVDVTVDVCPFKFGYGFNMREDKIHHPTTKDVSIAIGHEEMDMDEWEPFIFVPKCSEDTKSDAKDSEKIKKILSNDSEDVGGEIEKTPESKKDE